MTIQGIVANIYLSIWEPSMQILICCVYDLGKFFVPIDLFGFLGKKRCLILNRILIDASMGLVDKVVSRPAIFVGDVFVDTFSFDHKIT